MKLLLKRTYVLLAYFFSIFVLLFIHLANDALTKTQLFKEFWFIYLVVVIVLSSTATIDISK